MIAVSCGIKIFAVRCLVLSQYTHLTDRRTDGQNSDSNTVRCITCSRTVKIVSGVCQWALFLLSRFTADRICRRVGAFMTERRLEMAASQPLSRHHISQRLASFVYSRPGPAPCSTHPVAYLRGEGALGDASPKHFLAHKCRHKRRLTGN